MKQFLTILAFVAASTFTAFAQCPAQHQVNFSLSNAQQVGNFYFLPLDVSAFPKYNSTNVGRKTDELGSKTEDGALVICILDGFEKKFNVDVISFELLRDQKMVTYTQGSAAAYLHGIIVKARPAKK